MPSRIAISCKNAYVKSVSLSLRGPVHHHLPKLSKINRAVPVQIDLVKGLNYVCCCKKETEAIICLQVSIVSVSPYISLFDTEFPRKRDQSSHDVKNLLCSNVSITVFVKDLRVCEEGRLISEYAKGGLQLVNISLLRISLFHHLLELVKVNLPIAVLVEPDQFDLIDANLFTWQVCP